LCHRPPSLRSRRNRLLHLHRYEGLETNTPLSPYPPLAPKLLSPPGTESAGVHLLFCIDLSGKNFFLVFFTESPYSSGARAHFFLKREVDHRSLQAWSCLLVFSATFFTLFFPPPVFLQISYKRQQVPRRVSRRCVDAPWSFFF